jgi:hypothetical protein
MTQKLIILRGPLGVGLTCFAIPNELSEDNSLYPSKEVESLLEI